MPDISVTFSIIDNASSNLLKITQKNNDLHQSFIKTVQASNSFNKVFTNTIQTTNNLANKINLAHNQLQPFNNLLYSTGTSAGNLINPLTSATVSMNSFTSALSAANAKMMDFENQSTSVTKPLATILMNISQPTRARQPKQPQQPTSMMSKLISPFSTAISGFLPSILPYAAAYISIQTAKEGIKQMVETTNDLTLAKARLDTIGLSIDEVAQSAIRARTPLFDMTDALNMINTGAGYLFKDKNELVKFTETLNKQMIASGVTPERQKNALVQISQAMSLGVLRGQDFRTVMQDTPSIIKNLADYLGVAQNEVKGLADQGTISAEIFKNAVLSSTAEVDKKLEDMPMTYAQVWTNFKTQVTQALTPFLENIRKSIVESGKLTDALTLVANSLIVIANAADIAFNIIAGGINNCIALLEFFAGLLTRVIGDLAWIFTLGHFDKLKNLGNSMLSDSVHRMSVGGTQVLTGLSKTPVLFDPKTYFRKDENGKLLMPGESTLKEQYNEFAKKFQEENKSKTDRRGYPIVTPTYEEWVSGKQALQEQKEKIEAEAREAERKRQQEEIKKLLQTPPPTFNTGRTGRIGGGISRNIGRIASNTDVIARNTKSMEESIKRLVEFNMRTVVERATVNINMPVEQKFTSDLSPTGIKESANDILTKISQALEQSRSITGMQVSY